MRHENMIHYLVRHGTKMLSQEYLTYNYNREHLLLANCSVAVVAPNFVCGWWHT